MAAPQLFGATYHAVYKTLLTVYAMLVVGCETIVHALQARTVVLLRRYEYISRQRPPGGGGGSATYSSTYISIQYC